MLLSLSWNFSPSSFLKAPFSLTSPPASATGGGVRGRRNPLLSFSSLYFSMFLLSYFSPSSCLMFWLGSPARFIVSAVGGFRSSVLASGVGCGWTELVFRVRRRWLDEVFSFLDLVPDRQWQRVNVVVRLLLSDLVVLPFKLLIWTGAVRCRQSSVFALGPVRLSSFFIWLSGTLELFLEARLFWFSSRGSCCVRSSGCFWAWPSMTCA